MCGETSFLVAPVLPQCARRLEPGRPWVRTVIHDFDEPGSFSRFRIAAVNIAGESASSAMGPVGQLVRALNVHLVCLFDCFVAHATSA